MENIHLIWIEPSFAVLWLASSGGSSLHKAKASSKLPDAVNCTICNAVQNLIVLFKEKTLCGFLVRPSMPSPKALCNCNCRYDVITNRNRRYNEFKRFFFFFWKVISFIDIKKEHPRAQGVYKGSTNQIQKLQESRKSTKEGNDCFCKANNQSNKVLKKIAWGLEWISQYLQNIYYFSPSKTPH